MRRGEVKPAWSLVFFTVLTQAAVGLQILRMWYGEAILECGEPPEVEATVLVLLGVGMAAAVLHLGRPGAARFALSNLRSSRLSQELLLVLLFGVTVAAQFATKSEALGWFGAVIGVCLVLAIARVYMIRTVPAWNTRMTPIVFLTTTMLLGAAGLALLLQKAGGAEFDPVVSHAASLAGLLALGQVVLYGVSLKRLTAKRGPALAGYQALATGHGFKQFARVGLAFLGATITMPVLLATSLFLISELLGRYLFYAMHRRVGL